MGAAGMARMCSCLRVAGVAGQGLTDAAVFVLLTRKIRAHVFSPPKEEEDSYAMLSDRAATPERQHQGQTPPLCGLCVCVCFIGGMSNFWITEFGGTGLIVSIFTHF